MMDYNEQALKFLKDSGAEMKIRKTGMVEGFPFDPKDKLPHNRYSVTLIRNRKKFKFPFYDSADNTWKNKRPRQYDILACLTTYPVDDDMWDFANEFGYEVHCKADYERLERAWKGCRREYSGLLELFGHEWMERLSEIN